VTALLAVGSGVLLAAALWELVGAHGERGSRVARRALLALAARLPEPLTGYARSERVVERIRLAGLESRLDPATLMPIRVASAVLAAPFALSAAPLAPGRTSALVLIGAPLGAALAPDLVLARIAARRRVVVAAALPDALELMAVGAVSGGGPRSLLREAAHGSGGPLREELAAASAVIECGGSQRAVLGEVRAASTPELAAMAVALDRSHRLGSPIAEGLREQAASLRAAQTRALESRAAKAAPKIQLVVALLLVPSVLLMIAAAIIANSDRLLGGL
jgi:tight adherence protein C